MPALPAPGAPAPGAPAPAPPAGAAIAPRGAAYWRAVALGMAALFALRLAYYGFHDVADGAAGRLPGRLFEEATGALVAVPFVAGQVAFAWRVPFTRARWARAAAAHAAAFALFTLGHTTAMVLARALLAPAVGLGGYAPDLRPARYAYEAANDALPVLLVLGLVALAREVLGARERERREHARARSLLEAELRALRLQLQPHFLFNALNTVSETMYDDPRAADAQLGALAELLRTSLRSSHVQEVPVREELLLLEQYLRLARARFGGRLAASVHADPDALDLLVPSMLLQPLVENAVRHGGVETRGHGRVAVRVARARFGAGEAPGAAGAAALAVEVADDGPGLAPGRDPLAGGTGLSATAQRLALLYGDAHVLRAANRPEGGFGVRILVPERRAPGAAAVAPAGGDAAAHRRPAPAAGPAARGGR